MKKLKSLPSISSFASAGILKITPNSRAKVSNRAKIFLSSFKEIERQRRSYGNTVSLASLKNYFCVKTRFSTTATTVATGAILWKPGFKPGFHIIAPVATIAAVVEKRVSATVAIYGNTLFSDSGDKYDSSDERR